MVVFIPELALEKRHDGMNKQLLAHQDGWQAQMECPAGYWKHVPIGLQEAFTKIFNLSLQQAAAPTCLKSSTIINPVSAPKIIICEVNDYDPVELPHGHEVRR